MTVVETESRPKHDDSLGEDCECFRCHCLSITTSPYATPTRLNPKAAPRTPDNAWERGIPTDHRGMPFLEKGGDFMGQKEFSERRHEIEEGRRFLHNSTTPVAPPPSHDSKAALTHKE